MAENGSHSRTGNKEITLSICHSHTCCCGGMLCLDLEHPPEMLTMYFVSGRGGKLQQPRIFSCLRTKHVYLGYHPLILKLHYYFFFSFRDVKLSTPIIRNKLPLGLYLLLQLQGLREGQKEKYIYIK